MASLAAAPHVIVAAAPSLSASSPARSLSSSARDASFPGTRLRTTPRRSAAAAGGAAVSVRAHTDPAQAAVDRAACPPVKAEVPLSALDAVDLRVGVIVDAKTVPDAEMTAKRGKPTDSRTLLQVKVDVGGEERVVVSPCRYVMDVEDAVGKKVLIVVNVPPTEISGIRSHGVILTGFNYDPTPMPRSFKVILPGLGRLPPGSQVLPVAVPSERTAVATATSGVVKEEEKPSVLKASAKPSDREANGAIGDVKRPGDDAVPQDDDVVEQPKESDDREPTPLDTDDAGEDDPIVPDPLITTDMLAEQRQLEAERKQREEQQDAESEERVRREGVESSALTKLDVLLEKTKLFSESLLQQMDDITLLTFLSSSLIPPMLILHSSSRRHSQRKKNKTDAPEETLQEKISAAPSAAINGSGDAGTGTGTASSKEEEEAALLREQREIAPNLTGCTLKWYQIKGVKWLISLWQNGLNGILADQMGLGKTVQTIAFLAHLMSHGIFGPFLVVAPLSTLSNWVNEVKRFVPTANVLLYHGPKDVRAELREKHMPRQVREGFPIIVTSFEVAMFDRRQLQRYHWKYIVVDEGHRLKNMHCRLIRELRQLPAENTLLLSGTPLQNNLQELWSLLNFILPAIFSDLHEFTSWFDLAGRQSGGVVFDNERRSQVVAKLHQILRPFLLRRIKADVEQSLPKKKEVVLYAQLTEHQREFQDHLVQRTLADFLNSTVATSMSRHRLNNVVMQLRKNCNHPDLLSSQFDGSYVYPPVEEMVAQCGKLKLLDRLLPQLKAKGHKVLIFSQMTRLLDILDYYLEERGHHPFRLDGSVKLDNRRQQIEEFNTSPEAFIFLLSTRAGGLGINLTAADTVIIYDSDWNPHQDMQAMDRCHRIGQTRPVHVYRLATAHSVECRVLDVARGKLKLEHLVIEKGQFQQDKAAPAKTKIDEAEVLSLLRPERSQHDELVQSAEISDENLDLLLDRSDLLLPQPTPPPLAAAPAADTTPAAAAGDAAAASDGGGGEKVRSLPIAGPGWEVVVAGTTASSVLSSIG
ncbi:unnamed protein product [Closterium sp. Yama58-4]|nr:unnamed protein product [Closterium sp. Yama58-4]